LLHEITRVHAQQDRTARGVVYAENAAPNRDARLGGILVPYQRRTWYKYPMLGPDVERTVYSLHERKGVRVKEKYASAMAEGKGVR
jgi:hypothetical protein